MAGRRLRRVCASALAEPVDEECCVINGSPLMNIAASSASKLVLMKICLIAFLQAGHDFWQKHSASEALSLIFNDNTSA
jgi:hypothetical protein